jgi:hypothetical protein
LSPREPSRPPWSGGLMLGPLPPLHRFTVATLCLLASAGAGAWLAATLPVPLFASTGALVGAALGMLLVAVLVHDARRRPPAASGNRSTR